jgi:hypothetical protein
MNAGNLWWMDGRTDWWMDGWTDGRTDGLIDGWTDAWMERLILRHKSGITATEQKQNDTSIPKTKIQQRQYQSQTRSSAKNRLVGQITAGPSQHSHSWLRDRLDLEPYFCVSPLCVSCKSSQELSTCSYSEPDQFSSHHPIPPLQDPS